MLSIAAVTSGISILEVSVAYLVDERKMSRKKAVLMMAGLVYLAAIPCALSFNVLSDYTFNLQDKAFTFFDIADYLASNLLLPFGGFFLAVFAGYVWGIDEVIRNLLIEGGDKINKYILTHRLANQFYLFKSPKNLLRNKKNVIFTSYGILKKNYKVKSKIITKLAKDNITIYKR